MSGKRAAPAVSPAVATVRGTRAAGAAKRSKSSAFFRDSQAGFVIEEEPLAPTADDAEVDPEAEAARRKKEEASFHLPAPEAMPTYPRGPGCLDCEQEFSTSFLLTNFGHQVCNACRKIYRSGKYMLVTKTTAKNEYLLRDSELTGRPGALRFIERENPNSDKYSKMKLYLLAQVQEKSYERYGGADGLDKEHQRRDEVQQDQKLKRHAKKMAKMRKQTLTSTWLEKKTEHEHEYPPGDGEYNEDEDEYTKTCVTCGFQYTYEKM